MQLPKIPATLVLRHWLPLAFVTSVLVGFSYIVMQQNLRNSANDPQIQIAEDAAVSLANGTTIDSLTKSSPIDIATSLAIFATIYDNQGRPIVSSGKLDGRDPLIPLAVINYTKVHQEHRVTWQPRPNVRVAVVLNRYVGRSGDVGYVMVGRNVREVERRLNQLLIYSALAWAITLSGSLLLCMTLLPRRSDS
ncbi:MAG: hypothetical protein NVS1B7_5120 [Candidatus Saccharimonadales bacterium]